MVKRILSIILPRAGTTSKLTEHLSSSMVTFPAFTAHCNNASQDSFGVSSKTMLDPFAGQAGRTGPTPRQSQKQGPETGLGAFFRAGGGGRAAGRVRTAVHGVRAVWTTLFLCTLGYTGEKADQAGGIS